MELNEVRSLIEEKPAVLLYFWGEHCNVCHALQPKLFAAMQNHFPKVELVSVNVGEYADIAAHFRVFSIPTAILFFDGREFERVGRNVSIPALVEKIRRPYELLFS